MGRVEGDCIRCMYHGMKFDPSGKCIQIPGQDMIPAKLGVRSRVVAVDPTTEHGYRCAARNSWHRAIRQSTPIQCGCSPVA